MIEISIMHYSDCVCKSLDTCGNIFFTVKKGARHVVSMACMIGILLELAIPVWAARKQKRRKGRGKNNVMYVSVTCMQSKQSREWNCALNNISLSLSEGLYFSAFSDPTEHRYI